MISNLFFQKKSYFIFIGVILSFLLVLFGGYPKISLVDLLNQDSNLSYDIFIQARLPRALLGFIVGWGLSVIGVSFQSILRNPLADPYILGVSSGSALGGALALALNLPFSLTLLLAFLSGLASTVIIYLIAKVGRSLPVHSLLLVGVIYNSFCFALILLLHALVSIGASQQILYLMIGSLEAISYQRLFIVGSLVLGSSFYLFMQGRKMNVMVMGDESAIQLGLNPHRFRKKVFLIGSLVVSSIVTISGLIGFVGLLIPHICRLIVGPDHRILVPVSAIVGATFLMNCDWLAKNSLNFFEIGSTMPVGIITALLGGPFFIYLLTKIQRKF
jgi:iron complex transport system permease protein